MLLSRFWYIVLAAITGLSLAALFLVRSTYERDRGRDSETLLRGDRRQIDEFMRTEARVRLDNLGPLASSPDLTRAIVAANGRANDGPALRDTADRVTQQLRTLNAGMGGDASGRMLIAVDARGFVVGRVGLYENEGIGDYIGGIPVVARALDGFVRDDTWEFRGAVFRMAARPVIDHGRYAGAVIHARDIDDAFVQRISEALGGATVAFFASGAIYARHAGEPERGRAAIRPEDLADQIRTLDHDHFWTTRGYTDVLRLGNDAGNAVYGSLAGTVGLDGGGFAVGRPLPVIPSDFLLHPPSDESKRVPWPRVIGFAVVCALFGLLFVYLENDRGNAALRGMLQLLAERRIERLDPLELRGNARKTALAINDAFERAMKEELTRAGAAPRRSVEDLDKLLGPTASESAQPFADIPPPPPPAASPVAPFPPQAGPAPGPAPPPPRVAAVPHAPPPPPRAAPHFPPAPPRPSGPTGGQTSPALVAPPPGSIPAPVTATGDGLFPDDAAEQAHWREVFDQFVALKRQCHEDVSTLSYEKFVATLQKNKEALVTRTKCRAVRFQVYVKEGKATLKASPVK